jgi:hypothetical protein
MLPIRVGPLPTSVVPVRLFIGLTAEVRGRQGTILHREAAYSFRESRLETIRLGFPVGAGFRLRQEQRPPSRWRLGFTGQVQENHVVEALKTHSGCSTEGKEFQESPVSR